MGDNPLLKRLTKRHDGPEGTVTDLAAWKRRRQARDAGKWGLRRPAPATPPRGTA